MILARIDGEEPADVSEARDWAMEQGVSDGTNPEKPVTRQQLAAMLYRYEQSQGGGFQGLWAFRLDFADAVELADYAYEPMCWCTMNGVLSGYGDNTLRPRATASRAHMAKMLMNYLSA